MPGNSSPKIPSTSVVGNRQPGKGTKPTSFAIVAVGASAGGLEAFQNLLDALPRLPGMAFLFVQHLDPSHESLLPALLSRHTAMAVVEAMDGMPIEADKVAVIRPGTYLGIKDGLCAVSARDLRHGARLPFDHLLDAAAKEFGSRAVCIVLSGTGSDGSVGLKAIHAAGGLVFAQDPKEAASSGMPEGAIATGLADFVLPIDAIAGKLVSSAGKPGTMVEKPRGKNLATGSFEAIIEILRTQASHDFTHYKRGTLERRIERRMGMGQTRFADLASYLVHIRQDAAERNALCSDLLIHVTSFFRDPEAYEYLAQSVAADIVRAAAPDRPIRIWVAGCSSGEEAYSIGILFSEAIDAAASRSRLQIFASDLDADSIATARMGLYPRSIESDVSKDRLARYFSAEPEGYRVAHALRETVVFTVHDLLSDPPFAHLDLLVCRNLLIYLDQEAQKRAIGLFHFALNEGAALFLGSAETVGNAASPFEALSRPHRIFRNAGRGRMGMIAFPGLAGLAGTQRERPVSAIVASKQAGLGEFGRQMVLDAHGPAAVIVSLQNECLYAIGPIDRYLAIAQGRPSSDVLALARPGLRIRLGAAIQQAAQDAAPVLVPGVLVDGAVQFDIDVRPFSHAGEDFMLVSFLDRAARVSPTGDSRPQEDLPRLAELEKELARTRLEFQDAIRSLELAGDEQKAVNDETLSVNEEYQSSNEELLTSKEELQSLNEELTALNSQLQETLEHQRTTFNDLQNVLNSTDVATIFLDGHLNIRFYTPATRLVFGIILTDIGRPLADLTPLVSDSALLKDAAKVLETGSPIEVEIPAADSAWFLRRIQPYRGQDGATVGVVVTFANITARRHTADALIVAKREAEKATQAKSRFLAAASHDLRQPLQTLTLVQGLLAKTAVGEKQQTLIGRFDLMLRSMTGMLNALLDINQIDAGVVREDISNVSLGDLLSRLAGEFAYVAQAKGIDLRYVATSKHIRSNPRLIEQMIRNLMANALKYTITGRVLIGCRCHGDTVSIQVWDSGIGIASKDLKAIFDEYHQVDNAARETVKGLGLGLSIVKRLGDLLDHPIRVKSKSGKGSMFAIDVPRALVAGEAPALKTAPEAQEKSLATGAILVIEDDAPVREMLETVLRDAGHYVMAVSDADAAFDLAVHGPLKPDIILSDFNMPGAANGVTLAKKLRGRLHAPTPVVILTGDISAATLRTISQHGFSRLHKPVGPHDLIAMIDALLSQRPDLAALEKQPPLQLADTQVATVHIVDDDAHVRTKIRRVFEDDGYMVETYESCEAFLQSGKRTTPECLIVDAYLPGMSGLDLLARIKDRGDSIASIMITGESDVTIAVRALKAGVSDFIEKPVTLADLHSSVIRALGRGADSAKLATAKSDAAALLALLTLRQHQVMDLVLAGHPSKNIAADLGISQRTVENHRAAIMTKTGAKSLPGLARLAMIATKAA